MQADIKHIIAVASGKGGVGKSTTAVNLALALQHGGARVGVLDADIYGPSVPHMLGVQETPDAVGEGIMPIMAHGLQTMSIGYLVDQGNAVAWRGPMATRALQQLMRDTKWDNLDYLIIDLPPGTGDIHLTLVQKIPLTAAVIVTTPQDLALIDARRAVSLFNKVKVPVLGVIENMSYHVCSQCGHESALFGQGGGDSLAGEHDIEVLGKIPLAMPIREQADSGMPTVAADPTSSLADAYISASKAVVAGLALHAKDFKRKFPKIVIEGGR